LDAHPFLVHFPIALILFGTLWDAAGALSGRSSWASPAVALFAAGAVLAIVAAYTGEDAAERARLIAGIAHDLERHEELSTWTAWLSLALAVVRIHLHLKLRFYGPIRSGWFVLAGVCIGLVSASGYTGGRLVFVHGAGTRPLYQILQPEILNTRPDSASSRPNAGITEFRSRKP